MTTEKLELYKQLTLRLFAKYPRQFFKPTEIAKRIAVRGEDDYRILLKALHLLDEEQLIGKARRKRYGHAVPPSSQLTGKIILTKQGTGK
ncbi:MAG TPA: hypothetical protein VKS81_06795, partial [Bacteroidota bacterium]|nr:hypothetical protein [Bacteroidota bacterium]